MEMLSVTIPSSLLSSLLYLFIIKSAHPRYIPKTKAVKSRISYSGDIRIHYTRKLWENFLINIMGAELMLYLIKIIYSCRKFSIIFTTRSGILLLLLGEQISPI